MTYATTPSVLTPEMIDDLPEEPLGNLPGISRRVLWRSPTSESGVLYIKGGHRLGAHTHRVNHHHFWVLEGSARVMGQDVVAGSYVHVPSGVEHDVDATGTDGCVVVYLYLPAGD